MGEIDQFKESVHSLFEEKIADITKAKDELVSDVHAKLAEQKQALQARHDERMAEIKKKWRRSPAVYLRTSLPRSRFYKPATMREWLRSKKKWRRSPAVYLRTSLPRSRLYKPATMREWLRSKKKWRRSTSV